MHKIYFFHTFKQLKSCFRKNGFTSALYVLYQPYTYSFQQLKTAIAANVILEKSYNNKIY